MSTILCRSAIKLGRTNLVCLISLDVSHRCYPIISSTRHIHSNLKAQIEKPRSAPLAFIKRQEALLTKQKDISKRIVSCIERSNYDEALQLLHELLRHHSGRKTAVGPILDRLSSLDLATTHPIAFVAQLWDICADRSMNMRAQILYAFATSFEYKDDIDRMQQLANHMKQKSCKGRGWLSTWSLVLHALSRHNIVDDSFETYVADCMKSIPFHTIEMLQHRGALASFLITRRVDEAVKYLHLHASSLQLSAGCWNRAMLALCADGGRRKEIVPLYELWMSVLPPAHKLRKMSNFKEIVPDEFTYRILLVGESSSCVTPKAVLAHLDEFRLSSSSDLHTRLIVVSLAAGDHQTALECWHDMRKNGLEVNEKTVAVLMHSLKHFPQSHSEPSHDADILTIMLWDICLQNNFRVMFPWLPCFMASFRRTDDIQRTLDLTKMLLIKFSDQASSASKGRLSHNIVYMLETHNQLDELDKFETWIDIGTPW